MLGSVSPLEAFLIVLIVPGIFLPPPLPICSTSLKNKYTGCPPDVIRTGRGPVVAERVVHGAVCLWRTGAESNARKSVPDIGAGSGFCKKGASSTISSGASLLSDES